MYDAMVTIGGYVGTDVEFREATAAARSPCSGSARRPRWFDRSSGSWRDQETVWMTVKAWRGLAHNVKASVRKGEPVIVTGRLRASQVEGRRRGGAHPNALSTRSPSATTSTAARRPTGGPSDRAPRDEADDNAADAAARGGGAPCRRHRRWADPGPAAAPASDASPARPDDGQPPRLGAWPNSSSRCATCASGSVTRSCSTTSRCRSCTAPRSASSGPTAPASRPCSSSWPGSSSPTTATPSRTRTPPSGSCCRSRR